MKNKEILDEALMNFVLEADSKTIKEALGDLIPDMARYEQKKAKFKKELDFLTRAEAQQSKNDILLEVAKRFEEALLKGTEKPVAMLKVLIGANHTFALNKNFEKLTKEEIIEIIKDKNLIELLDKLNEE